MRWRWAVAVAALLILAGSVTTGEAAIVFAFDEGGQTTSGNAAPTPLTWSLVEVDESTHLWSLDASAMWPSSTSVTDFHISFTSRTISSQEGSGLGTTFIHNDNGNSLDWTRVINNGAASSSVDFFAPPGVSLDQGEFFFVQVALLTEANAVDTFDAHWTTDAVAVPEPATLTLLGAGLVALYAVRRRGR